MVTLGDLFGFLEKFKDAEHWYRSAIKVEESHHFALVGLAQCQLNDVTPMSEDLVKEQIQFLFEVQDAAIKPKLLLLSAKLLQNDSIRAIEYVEEAAEILMKNCRRMPYGSDYLKVLNPDLCLTIVNEYLSFAPNSLDKSSELFINVGKSPCNQILEQVIEACPGLSAALLLLGKLKLHNGDLDGERRNICDLLSFDINLHTER